MSACPNNSETKPDPQDNALSLPPTPALGRSGDVDQKEADAPGSTGHDEHGAIATSLKMSGQEAYAQAQVPQASDSDLHSTFVPVRTGGDGEKEEYVSTKLQDEKLEMQALMIELNESTVKFLTKSIERNPAVNLTFHIGAAGRKYKKKREEYNMRYTTEEPKALVPESFQHTVPTDGDFNFMWPIAPVLADLFNVPSSNLGQPSLDISQSADVRCTLSSVLNRGDVLHQLLSRTVVRISPDIVVKIGRGNDNTELSNLAHICRASQSLPVPVPLGMISINGQTYMFTTYIPGVNLDDIWNRLAAAQKVHIQEQLNAIFSQIRALPIPSKTGGLGGGVPSVCRDGRREVFVSEGSIANEEQFNDFLLHEAICGSSRASYLRTCLPSGHKIVMTHGDLHTRNVMVRSREDTTVTGIIDWEDGGGYPEYWEYVKALNTICMDGREDRHLFLPEEAIGRYTDAYARDCMIGRALGQ